jgi:hypothetical protein
MSGVMVNVAVRPYRLLTKSDAAHYCRRSVKKFGVECPVSPVRMPGGDELWDAHDLDRWIDGLKTGGEDQVEAIIRKLG